MGPKVRKLFLALTLCSVPISVVAVAAPAGAAPAGAAPAVAATGVDGPTSVVTWVNQLRGTVGAASLAADPALTNVAQQWANHMASTGILVHNPNLATQAPSGWTKMGENIGDGFSLIATYNALVASPDHYANMVDPAYNRTGVGVATDSKGQVWVAQDFGDYPPPPVPTFVFPTSGTVMFPSPQPFSWSQVPGGQYYCLTVGTTPGGVDLVNSGLLPGTQLSYTVPGLPGSTPLFARVYSYVQGTWTWADAPFSVTGPSTAFFTRPTAGATGVSARLPLTWTPVASAGYYAVTVGTTVGGTDVANSGLLGGTQSSFMVASLPLGKTLSARVYSYIAGSWNHYSDVTFTSAAS